MNQWLFFNFIFNLYHHLRVWWGDAVLHKNVDGRAVQRFKANSLVMHNLADLCLSFTQVEIKATTFPETVFFFYFESKYGLVKKKSTFMQNEGKENNKYEKEQLKASIQ